VSENNHNDDDDNDDDVSTQTTGRHNYSGSKTYKNVESQCNPGAPSVDFVDSSWITLTEINLTNDTSN